MDAHALKDTRDSHVAFGAFFFFSIKRIPDQVAQIHRLIWIIVVLMWRRDTSHVAFRRQLHGYAGSYGYSLFSCGVGTFVCR